MKPRSKIATRFCAQVRLHIQVFLWRRAKMDKLQARPAMFQRLLNRGKRAMGLEDQDESRWRLMGTHLVRVAGGNFNACMKIFGSLKSLRNEASDEGFWWARIDPINENAKKRPICAAIRQRYFPWSRGYTIKSRLQ